MKKNTLISFMLTTLLVTCMLFAGCTNQQAKQEQQNKQDTIANPNHGKGESGTQGGSGVGPWSIEVIVVNSKGEPISGASVSIPCTGQPDRITDVNGKAVFSGTGNCPCGSAQATITTNKGCNQKIPVTCNGTYTVTCTQ